MPADHTVQFICDDPRYGQVRVEKMRDGSSRLWAYFPGGALHRIYIVQPDGRLLSAPPFHHA